jgi:glutaminase
MADGDVNPVTNERVVDATVCRYVPSVMATAGLYEVSFPVGIVVGLTSLR